MDTATTISPFHQELVSMLQPGKDSRFSTIDPNNFVAKIVARAKQERHYYRVPSSQIPYLLSIDLGDISSKTIAIPPGVDVVRFDFDNASLVKYSYVSYAFSAKNVSFITAYKEWLAHVYFARDDISCEEHLQRAFRRNKHGMSDSELAEEMQASAEAIRMIVNVLMLRECNPKFFRPDILSADRAKYEEALNRQDLTAQETIEARARRRKGTGFVFDTGEDWQILLDEQGCGIRRAHGTGKERTRCWIRRGHWRRVHYGIGNRQVKWRFFPPQICRADLAKV